MAMIAAGAAAGQRDDQAPELVGAELGALSDAGRIDRIDGEVGRLRQDSQTSTQQLWIALNRIEAAVAVIQERDKQQAERATESQGWREQQLKDIRDKLETIRRELSARMDATEGKMVTKTENLPARVLGIGTLIAALVAIGGFVMQAWQWTGKGP